MTYEINLKMKCSKAFKDGEPSEDAEDPEEEAKKLKFPWHCEKGIINNIQMLNQEFIEQHELKPVKIFVQGPPGSGKTYFAKKLAIKYNVNLIEVSHLIYKAYEMANRDEEKQDEFC